MRASRRAAGAAWGVAVELDVNAARAFGGGGDDDDDGSPCASPGSREVILTGSDISAGPCEVRPRRRGSGRARFRRDFQPPTRLDSTRPQRSAAHNDNISLSCDELDDSVP